MPTPVTAARQCLTQEAAAALDEAVAVARRRGHAQTTSLHMVSSLLSLPNSSLREACTRTRNNAYSTRVQFKALELSLSVSLDRLPSSQASKVEEPPVSNSLMAAIKRSQANQRRQPENFTFYQQQQQQYSSSVPVVKVELPNLILSILDDPLVSRVFGEAGFRSCDIKIATLRPGNSFHPHHLFGYSSRIGEIMLRAKKRSPLLLGVSAADAVRSFLETVQRNIKGVLPEGLSGLIVVCVKDDILRYLNGDCDEGPLKLRFEEVEKMVESVTGAGVVVNFGDLKSLAGDGVAIDRLRYLVSNLSRLLEVHGRKLWLIGAAVTYDVYVKILNKLPTVEEDWDLEILPITSFKFSVGGSYPDPDIASLMESFVPLGGFFSMPPETKSPSSNACQYVVRCHLCNEKYEQEVAALSKGGACASVVEEYQSSLPSWLRPAEPSAQSGLASVKGKDDRLLLNAKIMAIQKKWDSICQQNHFNQTFSKGCTNQFGYQFPRVMGFQAAEDRKENASYNLSNHSNEPSNERGNKTMSSSLSTDLRQSSSLKGVNSSDVLSKANNLSILPKSGEIPSDSKVEPGGVKSHHFDSLSASINNSHTSPTSVTSVTTDLGLGIISASASREPEDQSCLNLVQDLSSANLDKFTSSISNCPSQSSSCFYHNSRMHSDVNDPKSLYRALVERVGQQEEAITAVVQTITESQTKGTGIHGISRRNIWINIRGPDRLGKKKFGLALAELLYGSRESLIYVDLSFQDEMTPTDALFYSQVTNKYDLTMRGTVIDYLVEKLSKKPSVVFFENIEKADLVVQNSLSQAVKTGRFTDLRGREVNISNCIFLGATRSMESSPSISAGKESTQYIEEDILKTKGSSIQMLIRFDLNDSPTSENLHPSDTTRKGLSDLFLMNKRKLVAGSRSMDLHGSLESPKRAHKSPNSYLDLNLPAEGSEICNTCSGESDSDSSSENSRSWLDEFEGQIDQIVFFKPFDFDTLAEKLFKNMNECLQNIVGSECSLDIEPKIMLQLLASAYLFGYERVEDWIQHVLGRGFMEAIGKFSLNARSVVKLVTYDGSLPEEQPEGLLPATIMMK
ncbi:protein SMAX1-LIKE 7 [Sesamum angolense]|uniref:Protein SMAX1-LIKE 7 n=1 Tax=Sesamum angolense TaxID=2727404 RepID=A0AAE2BH97_9LAMI|nr:protein SMAX1-LIKE 7 [Sesamum angolense]